MKKKLQELSQNKFLRNVSTLAVGTILSQVIVILGSIVLARIYGANSFGLLALFTSLATISAVLTTGRYEYSIPLAEKDSGAKSIVHLISILGFSCSLLFLIITILIRNLPLGKYSDLFHSDIIFLFPIYTFFISLLSALQYWNQRKKAYTLISKINFIQSVGNVFLSMILGFLLVENGLIIGLVFGIFVSILSILYKNRELIEKYNIENIKTLAIKYKSFPKYMLVSDVSMAFNQQFIPIIFSALFSSTIVGFYAMANRFLRLPTIVITTSIADVFRNEAIDRVKQHGNCTTLYYKTLSKLIVIALPVFILIYFISPFAIKLVLGEKWIMSGYFAQILCILLFFEFITTPLNSLFYIFERQKIYMRIQFLNSVIGIMVIYFSYKYFHDAKISLLFFSYNSAFFNIICLYFTYNLSKRNHLNL